MNAARCSKCLLIVLIAKSTFAAGISTPEVSMMQKLAKGSSAEVQLGKLVAEKASDRDVRNFAQKMVRDHTALLKQAESWASRHLVNLDSTPGEEEKKIYNEVSKLSGAEFDHKYIQGMLDDHKNDVAETAKFIVAHPNSEIAPILKSTLPILEDHLRIAENVAGKIGIGPEAGLNHPSGSTTG